MRVNTLSAEAARKLSEAGVPEARVSAEVLLSELLGVKRGEIPFCRSEVTEEQSAAYGEMIQRRERREPVQRILGYAYFRNLKLDLGPEALIPRPDTESVVDAALERMDEHGHRTILDVGTGSGAIAVSIAQERPGCAVHASDVDPSVLETARRNARLNDAGVAFHLADLALGLDALRGGVDLLVSNPPYVRAGDIEHLTPEVRRWDPALALDGGPDGLNFYRRIFRETPPLLHPGSEAVLEVGDGQAEDVLALGEKAGFVPLGVRDDLAGTPRAVVLRWDG